MVDIARGDIFRNNCGIVLGNDGKVNIIECGVDDVQLAALTRCYSFVANLGKLGAGKFKIWSTNI